MATDLIRDRIQVRSKTDALKLHLMVKCFQKGLALSSADISSLVELYETGYSPTFFKNCVAKGFYKSEQTVRNAVAKMTTMGILSYKKRGERKINAEFIPETKSDKVIIQYLVGNVR